MLWQDLLPGLPHPAGTDQIDQDQKVPWGYDVDYEEVKIERAVSGKPHKGKVLLAIQPHSDDIPLSAGGISSKTDG